MNVLCKNTILIERFVSESLFFKYFESEPDASRMLSLQNTAHCQFLRGNSTLFEYSRPKSNTSPMFWVEKCFSKFGVKSWYFSFECYGPKPNTSRIFCAQSDERM